MGRNETPDMIPMTRRCSFFSMRQPSQSSDLTDRFLAPATGKKDVPSPG